MENNVEHEVPTSSESTKNSINDEFCDENHANKSRSLPCDTIPTASNCHYSQSTLSEYFPKPEIEKPRDKESNSADVMVDFRKLVSQLSKANVVIEKLPQSVIKGKSYPMLQINVERMQLNPHKRQDVEETKIITHRYCHKCKTSQVDCKRTTERRKCHKCGADLLFVCDKCNGNLYQRHEHMERHRKSCDGQKKSRGQELTSIKFYYCADCEFFTAYGSSMKIHASMRQHKILERK